MDTDATSFEFTAPHHDWIKVLALGDVLAMATESIAVVALRGVAGETAPGRQVGTGMEEGIPYFTTKPQVTSHVDSRRFRQVSLLAAGCWHFRRAIFWFTTPTMLDAQELTPLLQLLNVSALWVLLFLRW